MHQAIYEEIARYVSTEDRVGMIPRKIIVPPDEVHVVNKSGGQTIHTPDEHTAYWKNRWTQVFKLSTKAIPVELKDLDVRDNANTPFTASAISIIRLAEPGVAAKLIGEDIALLREEVSKVTEAELRSAAVALPLDQIMRAKDCLAEQSFPGINKVARNLGFDLLSIKITGIDGEVVRAMVQEQEAKKDSQITRVIASEQTAKTRAVEEESRSQSEEKKLTERSVQEMEIAKEQAVHARQKERDLALLADEHELEQARIDNQMDLQERGKQLELARRARERELELTDRAKQEALLAADRKVREEGLRLQEMEQLETTRIDCLQKETAAVKEAEKKRRIAVIEAERQEQIQLIDATAKTRVAEQEALALRTQAQAMADEQTLLAEGEKAQAKASGLAEVEVEERRLEVVEKRILLEHHRALKEAEALAARLEAEAQGLRQRAEAYTPEMLAFELEKVRIEANKEVEIARAQAMAQAWGSANISIFGGQESLSMMSSAWNQGMALGTAAQGLSKALPPAVRHGLEELVTATPRALLQKVGLADFAPEMTVKSALQALEQSAPELAGQLRDSLPEGALDKPVREVLPQTAA